jgi:carbonic anhydrase
MMQVTVHMDRLFSINKIEDIPEQIRQTPVGELLQYQNMQRELEPCSAARLLVGMCMDHRKHLRIPDQFAYIIRSGGGNLRYSEFKVSYAIATGGVRHIALIGHDNCGMVNLMSRRQAFIDGLVEHAGWDRDFATEHFTQFAPMFEIGNEIDFLLVEAKRLRQRYPRVAVTPLYYRIDTNRLWGVKENGS